MNIIADFTEPAQTLGDGYRVEGRIVIWENENVLKIPSSTLFRSGDAWNVFVVESGRRIAVRLSWDNGRRSTPKSSAAWKRVRKS
jgi:hypothetical protein